MNTNRYFDPIIFDLLSSQAQEENISRYLMGIFWEIVHGIGEVLKIDCMELLEDDD